MSEWDSFGKVSILSVEDDTFNQELAAAVFDEFSNTTVYRANNGEEAMKIIEEASIDVILLDLIMPEMDGFETLKELKSSSRFSHIPVIVVTSEENEKKSTYKLGANDFISKPYNPEELKLRVLNHLRVKRFSDLLKSIKGDITSHKEISNNYLKELKEVLEIADNSQKQLLEKLGSFLIENGYREESSLKRVKEYAKLLAKLQGLNSKEIEEIYYSASIYDIGLLRIDKKYISSEDSKEYKEHPKLGLTFLDDIKESSLIKCAKDVVLYHHENWDGNGYPNGLKGEEIPICARIMSIVDTFDKLTTKRICNQTVMNSHDALKVIKRDREVKFDPKLLDIFIEHFSTFVDIRNRFS